jgi:catechol 2,3-dioxygenase-like lactoylglutathione lyase family enzyme
MRFSLLVALVARGASLRAGELLRISHMADDVPATAAFYQHCLGLACTDASDGSQVVGAAGGSGLHLKLLPTPGGTFTPNAGYQGLSARVPSVPAAVTAAVEAGGTLLREPATVVHGASQVPDENEEMKNEVVEALVADPSGYPLLLHECSEAEAPQLSGVRLEVHEWLASQEWWEDLGWHTLRWNSNVHREASLTITMGPCAADRPIGPRGHLSPSTEPVLQLTYKYGSAAVSQAEKGLHTLVLKADSDGESETELADPNNYNIVLRND